MQQHIAGIRHFNRVVTQRIGALEDGYLDRGRPLGEARLLFEIGKDGADIQELRIRLHLDSGYASRLLRSLEAEDLVSVGPDPRDGRRRRASLTEAGRAEFTAYDDLSDGLAASLLAPLGKRQRGRLVEAMAEVARLLRAGSIQLSIEAADSADALWCLDKYFAELAQRFEAGFDPNAGASAEAEKMPAGEKFLLARLDGQPVGCGLLRPLDASAGEIKRMWISPDMRGLGLAGRMLGRFEQLARESGFSRVRLDTSRSLAEAQAMYRKAGYREIARYNDNPYADFWFEKSL